MVFIVDVRVHAAVVNDDSTVGGAPGVAPDVSIISFDRVHAHLHVLAIVAARPALVGMLFIACLLKRTSGDHAPTLTPGALPFGASSIRGFEVAAILDNTFWPFAPATFVVLVLHLNMTSSGGALVHALLVVVMLLLSGRGVGPHG